MRGVTFCPTTPAPVAGQVEVALMAAWKCKLYADSDQVEAPGQKSLCDGRIQRDLSRISTATVVVVLHFVLVCGFAERAGLCT